MSDALVVQLELKNLAGVLGGLRMVGTAVGNLNSPMAKANQQVQQHTAAVKGISGPWGKAIQAYNKYLDAVKSGNKVQIYDARLAYQAANKRYQSSQQTPTSNFSKAVKNAIFSTRVGNNGSGGMSIMPLIGRLSQVVGSMGPWGQAIVVVTSALGSLGLATIAAAKTLTDLSAARYQGGGTYAQTGQAEGLGSLIGMDASGIAGIANQFRQSLGTPMGMTFGGNLGVSNPMGGMPGMGRTNSFELLFPAIEKLMKMPEQEALRMAQVFPELEPFLKLRDIDPSLVKEMMDTQKDLFNPEQVAAAMRMNVEMSKLHMILTKAGLAFAPLIGFLTDLLNILARMPTWMAGGVTPPGGDASKPNDDLKKNTEAVQENTNSMDRIPSAIRETFGGGPNARGAIPGRLRGEAFNHALRDDAIGLGAFRV